MSNHKDFRDPDTKYLKMEDILGMNIPVLSRIEICTSPRCIDDEDRGEMTKETMVYYAGVKADKSYDVLQFYKNLINGKPTGKPQGIMLSVIDSVTQVSEGENSVSIQK